MSELMVLALFAALYHPRALAFFVGPGLWIALAVALVGFASIVIHDIRNHGDSL